VSSFNSILVAWRGVSTTYSREKGVSSIGTDPSSVGDGVNRDGVLTGGCDGGLGDGDCPMGKIGVGGLESVREIARL
jgi:hypothetical protein